MLETVFLDAGGVLVSDARAPDSNGDSDIALDEAEVSFVTKDLDTVDIPAQSAQLSYDEAQAQVLEQVLGRAERLTLASLRTLKTSLSSAFKPSITVSLGTYR